jgi:hypothetical protein
VSEHDGDFKVVDKRHSAGGKDEKSNEKSPKSTSEGPGFVMKDAPPSDVTVSPQIDFSTFIFSLATGAFIHLGLAPDPGTNQVQKDLPLAKQDIELLAMLKEKTKGNLSADEQKLFESLLAEVRLRFVEVSKGKP